MRIHADLSEKVVLDTDAMGWVESSAKGVLRKMLDRDGAESGRATSMVKYEPRCAFPEHTHDGGEEFYVLEGVFCDEHGAYPAGTYVRNPMGTAHSPYTEEGCVIFVKLCQFDVDDMVQKVIDTRSGNWETTGVEGVERVALHAYGTERVSIEKWDAGVSCQLEDERGVEMLVLEGALMEGDAVYGKGWWLRLPGGAGGEFMSGVEGCRLWVKRGHLG